MPTTDPRHEHGAYLNQRLSVIGTTLAENAKNGVDNLFMTIMDGVTSVVAADHASMFARMQDMQDQIGAVAIELGVVRQDIAGVASAVASCETNIRAVKDELIQLAQRMDRHYGDTNT
jgi:septal ring factor EnvC (AmiA/AmiB activator)